MSLLVVTAGVAALNAAPAAAQMLPGEPPLIVALNLPAVLVAQTFGSSDILI